MATLPEFKFLDIGRSIDAFRAGQEIGAKRRERNTLSTAGEALAAGDFSAAEKALFEGGKIQQGLQLQNIQEQRKTRAANRADAAANRKRARETADRKLETDTLARGAIAARTPELWAQFIAQAEAKFGTAKVEQFRDFSARDTVINRALTVKQALDAELKRGSDEGEFELVNMFDPKTNTTRSVVEGSQEQAQLAQDGFILAGKQSLSKGTSLSVSPEGEVSFTQGGPISAPETFSPLTKATANTQQKEILQSTEILSALTSVERAFKPEFQELQTRFGNIVASAKAKAGFKIDEAERAGLQDFSRFKSRSINVINTRLNQLSGAAVSPQEAIRIRSGMPDPGDGLFDGDDPVTFKSKMDDSIRQVKLSIARKAWALKNGVSSKPWERFALEDMPEIMSNREAELRRTITTANPTLSPQEVNAQIAAQLRQDFNLGGQ